MSSQSYGEVTEQTPPALTPLANATTGTNNFLMAPARKKKTHSPLRQAEKTLLNLAVRHHTVVSDFVIHCEPGSSD